MRKFIALLTVILMVFATLSFASVGLRVDNTPLGSVTDLQFDSGGTKGQNKAMSFDGSKLIFNLLNAGTGTSGAVSLGTGSASVDRGYSVTYKEIGTTKETGTVRDGLPGELITIIATEVGSAGIWVITSAESTTWLNIEFDSVGDAVSLLWANDTIGWIIFGNPSASVRYQTF